jgi:hypothetical protein
MNSEFYFDPSWRVIVCRKCKTCVKPESASINRHLRRKQHGLKGGVIKQQVSLLIGLNTRSEAELKNVHPEPTSQPVQAIPHLQILDGFRCRHCPDKLTTNVTDRHACRHGLRPQDPARSTSWEECKLQTLFAEKSLVRYFRVREASRDGVAVHLNAAAEAEVEAVAAEDTNVEAVTAAITSLDLHISSQEVEDSNPPPEGGHNAFNDIIASGDEDANYEDDISGINYGDDHEGYNSNNDDNQNDLESDKDG